METKKEESIDVKTEGETAQESKATSNTESIDNKEIKKEESDPLIDEFYSEIDDIKQEDFKSSSKEQLERLLRPGSTYFNLNPFQVLQIDPYASIEEIKRKYRKLSTYVHPDKNPNDKERAEIAFEAVNRAYKMLEDEKERKQCLEVVDEAREQVEKMDKYSRIYYRVDEFSLIVGAIIMGVSGSVPADTPADEHFYGLVNFGNTCYVNSVLQALYFCKPFREKIIQYRQFYNQQIANLSNKELNNLQNVDIQQNDNNNNLNNSYNSLNSNNSKNNGVNSNATTTMNNNSNNVQQQINMLKQEHLLNCLAELFYSIVVMKKKRGVVHPKKFIARLRKDNESFDNLFQQDAHEFLNYLLNTCADILKEEMKELKKLEENARLIESYNRINTKNHRTLSTKNLNGFLNHSNFVSRTGSIGKGRTFSSNGSSPKSINSVNSKSQNGHDLDDLNGITVSNSVNNSNQKEELTWIHELFQGILVNETKCLNCETSSSKEENFLDLSVDIEQNTSISHCLQKFSDMEKLCGECKYYCENCCSKQEAEKRMRIKKLPQILALHLKRFKFVENRFKKLNYRVVFPFELRLFNTTEDCSNSDRLYDLVSFVVHCGIGLNRGHYISVVKSGGFWFLFDDEQVERIEASNFEEFYGLTEDTNKKSETSYILFYQSREFLSKS